MFNSFAARRPPTIRNLSTRTRRFSIGAAAVVPALLIGVLGSTHSQARDIPGYHAPPQDSGLVACSYPLTTQSVSAADYQKIRAEFAASLAGSAQRRDGLRRSGRAAAQHVVQ